jgi:glutamate---cysteine ligase / carboxylate-amine ligase
VEHAFGSSFTVGVEEELFLVEPPTFGLVDDAERVLGAMDHAGPWQAAHEAFACEVELRSPPEASPVDAVAALRAAREAARAAGAMLMAAGLHPTSEFGNVTLVRSERYARVEDSMRGLIRRAPECALHVHVGMPDAETAIRVFNGLRGWLPLFEALAANSPWWHGLDSGMASARAALVRAYPSRGIPRALRDWGDYEAALDASAAGGGPDDYTMIWWDVRLHPRLGTVEVRELDAQSRLDDVMALAALIQALARLAAESPSDPAASEAIAWSAFLAARDGLDAEVLSDGGLLPVREAARRAVERARPHSPEPDALDGIERILRDGGGADRRRAAHRRGGMKAMLEELVAETAEDLAQGRSAGT